MLRRLAVDERGMTLIEVMVAAVVLVVGILALLMVFANSAALNTRSEREAQAADFAEQQVELLLALPYSSLELTSVPTDATWLRLKTTTDAWYVAPLGTETAVAADATNGKLAGTGTWEDNRMVTRGNVYRYVTWGDDPAVPGTQNFKRIVVAVTDTGAGGLSRPVVAQAVKQDPDASNVSRGTGGPCLVIGVVCPG